MGPARTVTDRERRKAARQNTAKMSKPHIQRITSLFVQLRGTPKTTLPTHPTYPSNASHSFYDCFVLIKSKSPTPTHKTTSTSTSTLHIYNYQTANSNINNLNQHHHHHFNMKVYLAAAASLLLEPINAQQLASNQRRLRNRNLSDSIATLSKAGKSKASKSMEAHSLTGRYRGFDTEDATPQQLYIVCDDDEDKDEGGLCNITLYDARFSTCEKIVPGTNGGVGIANDIPKDSIDNFFFKLYCLQPGETVIDFTNDPTATLPGNIDILQDGSLRRTVPDFFYSKTSLPEIKDVSSDEVTDINDESFNPNGSYRGNDLEDGSVQVS